MLTETEVSFLS